MTSRRDFLKSFAALASGLALAPARALSEVQRLGTPAEWVEPDDFASYNQTHRFGHNVIYTARSGWADDPNTWERGVLPSGGHAVVRAGHVLTIPSSFSIRGSLFAPPDAVRITA
jgi:hypothetical protein